jgi:YD repeat-containing protein
MTLAQQSPHSGSSISDREKAGLRGPVKEEIDSQTMSLPSGEKVFTTTTKYTVDGRILEKRATNPDGSEWVTSYSYYPDGRLLKIVTGNAGSTNTSETTNLYDEQRRLVAIKSGDKIQIRYQYDDRGRKSAIETCDSKPLPPNVAYAPHWEGTDLGFVPSPGGKITTMYNEQGVATGAQFYDAEGNLLGHIVRKFDTEGRVVAEEQTADAHQENLPEELQSKLNAEQMKSVGTLMAGAQNSAISYSYDTQGRVTERHRSGGFFGEQVTVTKYNEYGDKASERETTVMRPDTGPWRLTDSGAFIPEGKQNPPQPPLTSETQYTYRYDQYGNWIEQTVLGRSQPDESFRPATVIRRKLTYY